MPRKARIDAPGALHHIIIRGIERKAIFKDSADRRNFLERCSAIISETETGCYAWVFMTNHIHMLLKTGLAPIATVMRRLLTGYAVSFNPAYWRDVTGTCFKIDTNRFCVKRRPTLRNWFAIFT